LFVDKDTAGKDIGPRPLAAGHKTTLNQQEIRTSFCSSRHGCPKLLAEMIKGSFPLWDMTLWLLSVCEVS
jgi:hypothetical protein